ncbi:MAG: hypothetical protein WC823_07510 [Parcubacteria group bacterium]|jgi:hypothetical protein
MESSTGKISITDLIKRIGAGKAYAIFGDALGEAVMANFSFKDWRDVFRDVPKNSLISKRALGSMIRLAITFDNFIWLYMFIEDEVVSGAACENAFRIGSFNDWIEWYKEYGSCSNGLDGYLNERMRNLSQKAVAVIKQITVI